MNKKRIIVGVIISLLLMGLASAQEGGRHHKEIKSKKLHKEHRRFGKLAQELDLSVEQKKKVYELIGVSKDEARALGKDMNRKKEFGEAERKSIKAKRDQIKSGLDADIMAVLDEDQKSKYHEIIVKRDEKMAAHEALREELRVYRIENIEPVQHQQRLKLEAIISPEDKVRIAELREEFINDDNEKGRRGQDKRQKLSQEQKGSLKSLIETYKNDIDALHDEISVHTEEWKSYMQGLKHESQEGAKNKVKGRKGKKRLRNDKKKYVRFLLMEVDE